MEARSLLNVSVPTAATNNMEGCHPAAVGMNDDTQKLSDRLLDMEKKRLALKRAHKAALARAQSPRYGIDPLDTSRELGGFSFAAAAIERDIQETAKAIWYREMALLKEKYGAVS